MLDNEFELIFVAAVLAGLLLAASDSSRAENTLETTAVARKILSALNSYLIWRYPKPIASINKPQTPYPPWQNRLRCCRPQKDRSFSKLFERSYMEYEHDRLSDSGGEPSLTEMTDKAIDILSKIKKCYVLMVETGLIDLAHHAGNAYRTSRFSPGRCNPNGSRNLCCRRCGHFCRRPQSPSIPWCTGTKLYLSGDGKGLKI